LNGLTGLTGLGQGFNVMIKLQPPHMAVGNGLHPNDMWMTLVELLEYCLLEFLGNNIWNS